MKSFKLTSDGDFEVDGNGTIQMVEGVDALKQRLKIKLSTNLNEWFLDTSFGVDWIGLLGNKASHEMIKKSVARVVTNDDATKKIEKIELQPGTSGRFVKIYIVIITMDDISVGLEMEVE